MPLSGFKDASHRSSFEAARARTQRGQPGAATCGARTRNGATCQHPPVSGFRRCRLHLGPAGSHVLRRRELDALARGELSHEAFVEREARRAANRLVRVWRRQPWTPGATLDLGTHEHAFADAMAGAGYRLDRVAPAVADAARWRWRRTMVDRRNHAAWLQWVTSELPSRVEAAGAPPAGWSPVNVSGVAPAFRVERPPGPGSRRRTPDRPRAVQTRRPTKPDRRRVRALDAPADEGELSEAARWFFENREALGTWAARVTDTRGLLILHRGLHAAKQGDFEVWATAQSMLA